VVGVKKRIVSLGLSVIVVGENVGEFVGDNIFLFEATAHGLDNSDKN